EWETGLASDALEKNDLAAAETHLRRATAFAAARQADVAWTRLAETLSRGERFEDALAAATEATRLFPRGLHAPCERAYARAALGDLDGAAADYRRALEGAGSEILSSPRLRHDAERVLATETATAAPRDLDAAIEAALASAFDGKAPWGG